ncbi:MAG: hypothetical protein RBS53_09440, partial [Bacteroidales bacterium]|nr:hypothetical protein [Bacteroidales bacterium]
MPISKTQGAKPRNVKAQGEAKRNPVKEAPPESPALKGRHVINPKKRIAPAGLMNLSCPLTQG